MIDTARLLAESFAVHAEHHQTLGSTQTHARALAERFGAASPQWPALVLADRQTAGRGRGASRWWTGEGSLAFSLVVDPRAFGFPPKAVPGLSLAAGVAVIDAVAPKLAGHGLGLHWPNDVYVNRGKLAGVLVEVLQSGLHIIGVGLNSNNTAAAAPEALRTSIATLLDLTGTPHDHTELMLALLENLEAALVQLGEDPESLGRRFDMLCRLRSEVITVYQGEHPVTGRCAGIACDGSLLLDTPEGRRSIQSGTLKPPGSQW